jgi:phage antirepressor YoqD-like protein
MNENLLELEMTEKNHSNKKLETKLIYKFTTDGLPKMVGKRV